MRQEGGKRKRKMTSRLKRRIGRINRKSRKAGRWDRDSCQTGESGKGRTDETEGS